MGAGASVKQDHPVVHYPTRSVADISQDSKLSFVAVLREWQRWVELGCDEEGMLLVGTLKEEYPDDMLMHKVIDNIPSMEGQIAFTDFCRFLYVWQTMTMEERLQSLFQILNSGDPLTTDVVSEIIKFQRPNDDIDQIKLIAAQMPASLACLGTTVIDEEDFVAWAKNLPALELDKRLSFVIVDQNIMAQLEAQDTAPQ